MDTLLIQQVAVDVLQTITTPEAKHYILTTFEKIEPYITHGQRD